jgi:hypothetical protein
MRTASPELEALLSRSPEDYRDLLVDVIDRFYREVFVDLEDEAMGAIERDVAHRRQQLEEGTDPAAVVLEATNGFELGDDPEPAARRCCCRATGAARGWCVGRLG